MYELVGPDVGLPPLVRRVPPGTSLLVRGPVMSRKERLVIAVLATGGAAGDGMAMVSTDDPVDAVRSRLAEFADADASRLGVVDCTGSNGGEGLADAGTVQHVPSPNDLTGIGIGITRALESLPVEGRHRLGFDSLSTLLAYRDPEAVFKFCHVVLSRLEREGCCSVMTLDTDAHADRTVNLVSGAFDGTIDVREPSADADHDRSYELRLRGVETTPEWTPVDLP